MIGFYLKKNFFDGWDNFIMLAAQNLICYIALVAGYFFVVFTSFNILMYFISLFISLYIALLFLFSISINTAKMAQYKSIAFLDIFKNLKIVWKDTIFLTLLVALLIIAATISLPFYFNMGGALGIAMTVLVFWLVFMTTLSLQWFMPLSAQLKGGFIKTLKKSFLIFLDNAWFSIFVAIYSLLLLIVSPFLAFIIPSFSGISLAQNNALKLRMYKYDWLEEHPEVVGTKYDKQIPWDELCAGDDEIIGPRTLRNLIFPWK